MPATVIDMGATRAQAGPPARRIGHRLLGVATLMSLLHHVDHIARGNHSGWPVTDQVTPFSYSLAVYPLIAIGLWLERSGRARAPFWTLLSGAGVTFLVWVHVGPAAVEPPAHIIYEYDAAWVGVAAFGGLLALIAALTAHCVHHARIWRRTARR